MRYTFTIEIPDKRGSHENDHVDFLKAASKQMEETLDYATCREGKRLMAKLKDKAGCSETELIEECWEAADEVLGKKSCAIIGEALTGSTKETKPDPFAKVAEKTDLEHQEEQDEEEEISAPAKKPSAPAKKFPFKKKAAPPVAEEEVLIEEEEDEEEATAPSPPAKKFPFKKKAPAPVVEEDSEIEEDSEVEASTPPPPSPPSKKFPSKKFPFKKAPSVPVIEEDEHEAVPEQVELLPDEEDEEIEPQEAPSSPPTKKPGVKRPAKGMTGFAKKSLPFKKLPKFKKP